MLSTMKSNLFKTAKFLASLLFWVVVWEVCARLINHSYLLPTLAQTFSALWKIVTSGSFFSAVFLSIVRVLSGLVIGTLLAIILAALSYRFEVVKLLLSPLLSVVKATPIASIIILLWIMLNGDLLAIFISVLMVLPIIWQNLTDGYDSIDKELFEVCQIFNFSYRKRLRVLIIPALIKYFIPALITSVGLAWKAVISAEIIAYVNNSIGQFINDAKYNFDSPSVFAWTLIVIIFSLLLEKLTKYLLARCKKWV